MKGMKTRLFIPIRFPSSHHHFRNYSSETGDRLNAYIYIYNTDCVSCLTHFSYCVV